MTDIHSCSYYCDRPGCIKAQRDELRDSNGAGNQVPPCTQPAPAQEPDMRHPKIQALIGGRARLAIQLQLVEQLLEDPNFETTSIDMEHWGPLHDKLKAALTAQIVEELQALCDRLSDILTRTAAALKGPPPPLTLHDWSDLPEVAAAQRLSDEPVAYRTEHDDGPMLWHDLAEARLYCDDGVEPTPLYARGAP